MLVSLVSRSPFFVPSHLAFRLITLERERPENEREKERGGRERETTMKEKGGERQWGGENGENTQELNTDETRRKEESKVDNS